MRMTMNFGSFRSARSVVGGTIHELGQKHDNVWGLAADTGGSLAAFRSDFPDIDDTQFKKHIEIVGKK